MGLHTSDRIRHMPEVELRIPTFVIPESYARLPRHWVGLTRLKGIGSSTRFMIRAGRIHESEIRLSLTSLQLHILNNGGNRNTFINKQLLCRRLKSCDAFDSVFIFDDYTRLLLPFMNIVKGLDRYIRLGNIKAKNEQLKNLDATIFQILKNNGLSQQQLFGDLDLLTLNSLIIQILKPLNYNLVCDFVGVIGFEDEVFFDFNKSDSNFKLSVARDYLL